MHPSALLRHAASLVAGAFAFSAPADAVASDYFRTHRELGSRERRIVADTLFSVLRQRMVLEHLARDGPGALPRRLAILGWAGEARILDDALDDAERAFLAAASAVDRQGLPEALRLELPPWIVEALRPLVGGELPRLAAALGRPAPLDLRVNVMKGRREPLQAELAALGIGSAPTPLSPWGLRVEGKPALERLPPFLRGEFEMQDEGSQLLALVVGARRGETVVDFCAGAGGKSLAMAAAMQDRGRVLALDVSAHRLEALKERLPRAGLSEVYPVQIAHERDDKLARWIGKADRVLVDAPCSGLGTLRRHPDLKWRQTPETVAAMHDLQLRILVAAARLVKPGGRLVYATCSLLAAENEAIAAAFSASNRGFAPVSVVPALQKAGIGLERAVTLAPQGALRLWPHRDGTDGFFAVAWERN